MRVVKPRVVLVPLVLLGLFLAVAPGYAQPPLVPRGSHTAPNFQSCGMIAGCSGPFLAVSTYNLRYFSACPATCIVAGTTNADTCYVAFNSLLVAGFTTLNDTSEMGCDFSCPGQTVSQQNCSIRGADGLPVELMEFSVESEEAAAEKSEG